MTRAGRFSCTRIPTTSVLQVMKPSTAFCLKRMRSLWPSFCKKLRAQCYAVVNYEDNIDGQTRHSRSRKRGVSTWQNLQVLYQGIVENGDKRTDNWMLVHSPVPVACISLGYLIISWAGPKLMSRRSPVNLKPVLLLYNFAMVCLSAYMCHEFLASSWLAGYSLLCQPVDYSDSPLALRMARVYWWFFFSKIIELCDTMFFILRKKNSQLTFLHVYHHATMMINCWIGIKYVAGGQNFFIGLVNSLVHVVMYLYYALAALGPGVAKHLWWKRYITFLQLLQLLLVTTHSAYNMYAACDYPDSINALQVAYALSLTALFCNFYYQSYLAGKKTEKAS